MRPLFIFLVLWVTQPVFSQSEMTGKEAMLSQGVNEPMKKLPDNFNQQLIEIGYQR
jgi:hypothetical protein